MTLERIDDHLSELTYNRYTEGFTGSPLNVKIERDFTSIWMYQIFIPYLGCSAKNG